MAINEFKFNLDIEKDDYIPKFKVKQYDTAIFYVNLLKNGSPFSAINQTIKIFVKKSDGTIVYQEDEISLENSTIKINVRNQAFTAPGMTYAELELKSTDGQVTTSTFLYRVKEKVGSDEAIESITDMSTLDKLDKYIEESQKELDKFKKDLAALEDLVQNKDKLEGQNSEAKVNIKELEKILEDANNITSDEGKYVTGNNIVSESANGYIQGLKLYGRSFANVTSGELPKQGSCAFDSIVATSTHRELKVTRSGSCVILRNGVFKRNTEYTVIVKVKLISDINDLSFSFYDASSNSFVVGMHTIKKSNNSDYSNYVIKLNTYNYDVNSLVIGYHGNLSVDSILGVKDVLVLEGDYTQTPLTYFEGIGNGYGLEVSSCNNQLVMTSDAIEAYVGGEDSKTYTTGVQAKGCKSFVFQVPSNSKITVEKQQTSNRFTVSTVSRSPVSGDKVTLLAWNITGNKVSVITPPDAKYMIVYVTNNVAESDTKELYASIGDIALKEPKKQDTKPILFKDKSGQWKYVTELPGLWKNGVFIWGDTIELHSDGKYYYHKRMQKDIFDGSREWTVLQSTGNNNTRCYSRFDEKYIPLDNNYILCDKINLYNTGNINENCIGIDSNGNIVIGIKNSLLPTPDSNGLKKYLQQNHMTLISRLPKEEVYECLDISVRSFRSKTMLSIKGGTIDPGVSYYVPTGFLSSDNSISEKVESVDKYLEENIKDIKNLYNDIEQVKNNEKITLKESLDKSYFHLNNGFVKDFNNVTTEGKYYVYSDSSSIPNAPTVGSKYGMLNVLKTNDDEFLQIFVNPLGKTYYRFHGFNGWSVWDEGVLKSDFSHNRTDKTSYTVFPNGFKIQTVLAELTMPAGKVQASLNSIPYPLGCTYFSKTVATVRSTSNGAYTDFYCTSTENSDNSTFNVEIRRTPGASGIDINVSVSVFIIGM